MILVYVMPWCLGAGCTLVAADLSATADPGIRFQSPVFLDEVDITAV
jgi:hypothetical protein